MAAVPAQEFVELLAVARGYQQSRALTVAAELGIADLLRDGPVPVDDLAVATQTSTEALYRLLRALASIGVFDERSDRTFALTPMGEYLRSDHPLAVGPVARMFGADYEWQAWGELPHAVRTGENAAVQALGVDVWEHRRQHPDDNAVFDAAMRTFSSADAAALGEAFDFGQHRVIADIGGGTGAALAAILRQFPTVRGLLFDQPQVVAHAGEAFAGTDLAGRMEIVPGDFFESVPPADAYMLRRVLHDWRDPEAIRILQCIRRAIRDDGCLLVLEAVVGPPNKGSAVKFLDLMMLVSAGGQERTEAEWASLLAAGGFDLTSATRATPNLHVIEATPR